VSKAFSSGKVFLSPAVIEEIDVTIRRLSPKVGEGKTESLLALWKRFASRSTVLKPVEKQCFPKD